MLGSSLGVYCHGEVKCGDEMHLESHRQACSYLHNFQSEIGQIMQGHYNGKTPIGRPSYMVPMTMAGIAFVFTFVFTSVVDDVDLSGSSKWHAKSTEDLFSMNFWILKGVDNSM